MDVSGLAVVVAVLLGLALAGSAVISMWPFGAWFGSARGRQAPARRRRSAIERAEQVRALVDALLRTPYVRSLEVQVVQLRTDMQHRLADRDAVIGDLRVRLTIAETDALRAKTPPPVKARPVPDFAGPVPFQDELAKMSLEVDETPDEAHGK